MSVEVIRKQKRNDELANALKCWKRFVAAISGVEDEVLVELEIESDQEGNDDEQLELELSEKKAKKKAKPQCVKGNPRHHSTKKHAPPGVKPGTFAKKDDKLKVGSWSIAAKSSKSGCRRGKTAIRNNSERFLPDALRKKCGRDDRSRKGKCSDVDESVKVPDADGDGMVSVEQFSLALDRKQRQIEVLKATIQKLKTQKRTKVSINDFIRLTNSLARAEKGTLGEPPKKKG